jgi:hypothetical protein
MVIANPNFELLLPNDILFRPIRIVFAEKKGLSIQHLKASNATSPSPSFDVFNFPASYGKVAVEANAFRQQPLQNTTCV